MNTRTHQSHFCWLGVIALLTLLPLCGRTQDVMPHEELMRRARGLAPVANSTNTPAVKVTQPIVVAPVPTAPPAISPVSPAVTPIPATTPDSTPAVSPPPAGESIVASTSPTKSLSTKAVFSPVPPEFFDSPPAPAPGSKTASLTSTNALDGLDDKHQLAIGDRLSFRIVEDEEEPRPLLVTDSGELEVPYLGRFAAVGKSCKQLAAELKAELEKEYYYRATVILAVDLMARSRGKVYLVGPVRMPGPQEIPSDEVLTISKAILRAGGFTEFADKKSVKITRKGDAFAAEDQTFTINVGEILERGRTENDLPLLPGDLVYIQERTIRF